MVFFLLICSFLGAVSASYVDTIGKLSEKLKREFVTETKDFSLVPPHWAELKGLYRSGVHFNFLGGTADTELRRKFFFPDLNMFVTNFVVLVLLEMHDMEAPGLTVDPGRLVDSLEAVLTFQDRNFAPNTPIFRFWPFKLINGTYSTYPPNLMDPLNYLPDAAAVIDWVAKLLHLGHFEEEFDLVVEIFEHMIAAFRIPSDADDAFCNLALGSLLQKLSSDFPASAKLWNEKNVKYETLLSAVVDFSYRPLAESTPTSSNNQVDPRTYCYAVDFVDELHSQGETDAMIPATWLFDLEDCKKKFPLEGMPFSVNNVDTNVVMNVLFGATYFFLYHPEGEKLLTDDFRRLYKDGARYVEWGVNSGRLWNRSDLALTYYPMIYDFYWFAGRTLYLLENYQGKLPFVEMEYVRDMLEKISRGALTAAMLREGKAKGSQMYWDDFLGDYGGVERGEDRLFSTGLACNALIDYWTEDSPPPASRGSRRWVSGVPSAVKLAAKAGLDFINEEAPKDSALLGNAFFSGSERGEGSSPFAYPGNRYVYLNGTKITTWPPEDLGLLADDLSVSVEGYVKPEEYEKWMHLTFFGNHPSLTNSGYNNASFPFWSSDAMTLAVDMMALAKYLKIEN